MALAVFDKALELRNIADGAETATASETGVSFPVRFMGTASWVVHVAALDAVGADETYVFTLEVSNLVGGSYTAIASLTWPRARSSGVVYVPVSGYTAAFEDADSAFVRVTCTQGGVSSSITYGSYLTKDVGGNMGIAVDPGETVIWA